MSIFQEHCVDYLQAGYSVIPDKGKRPMVKGWTDYCKRQPTLDEVKEWCTYKDANIAICLGETSGVIALDFDETDPEIIKVIEPLLPDSPVERVGKKGFVRFFQYSGEPTQNVYIKDESMKNGKRIVLEVLSSGKKVTIAPSIHPDTKQPYRWTKKPLLDVDISELPKFPPMLIAHLQSKLQMLESTTYGDDIKITEGRNLSLSTQTARIISNPHTVTGAIKELIQYDKDTHDIPLFTDPEEGDCVDANYNALLFYLNHIKSINNKRLREGDELELPIMVNDLQVLSGMVEKDESKDMTPFPTPTGMLKMVYEHILDNSYIEQPVFALSAAMSLIGTLASRKIIFQGTTPNMYLLNIADSGSGKDSCQQVIKNLLFEIKAGQHLLGATSYPSEASIIQGLDTKPVRLDIIDEASTFLSAATKGGNSYAVGIGDTLCELFSCSNSYYLGKSLASSQVRIGAVHRPHINLLCSTTYRGVNESISITALEKGLFARFLVFFGENNKAGKRVLKKGRTPQELLDKLTDLYNFENPRIIKKGNLSDFNAPAYKVPVTRTANDMLSKHHAEFDKMRVESKSDGTLRPIISRLYQHMLKIVLVSAIGNKKVGESPLVKPQDVEFGYQLVKYYYDRVGDFVQDNLYESQRGMKVKKVLNVIKSTGAEGLTNAELANQCQFLNTSERVDIIKDLKEGNKIIIQQDENNQGGFRFYHIGKEKE